MKPMTNSNDSHYSPEELAKMIEQMEGVTQRFYNEAAAIGNHAFIEFCGLMGEYVKICRDTLKHGDDFTLANTHTGIPLAAAPYQIEYIFEKMDCIFGPTVTAQIRKKMKVK